MVTVFKHIMGIFWPGSERCGEVLLVTCHHHWWQQSRHR